MYISHRQPKQQFQSTLPMKGATLRKRVDFLERHVSIHAPNEGSDLHAVQLQGAFIVSIHAPNEGSDTV